MITKNKVKAWRVSPKDDYWSTVVFAKTRGQARYLAQSTDACEYLNFIDIEVKRLSGADCLYREGKVEVDWDNKKERAVLIKNCDFRCECVESESDCKKCPAVNDCLTYDAYMIRQELRKIE